MWRELWIDPEQGVFGVVGAKFLSSIPINYTRTTNKKYVYVLYVWV